MVNYANALELIGDIDYEVQEESVVQEDDRVIENLKAIDSDILSRLSTLDKAKGSPDALRIKADRLIDISLGIDVSVAGEDVQAADDSNNQKEPKEAITNSLRFDNNGTFDAILITNKVDPRLLVAQAQDNNQSVIDEARLKLAQKNLPDFRTFEEKELDGLLSALDEIEIIKLAIGYYEQILIDYPAYSKNDYIIYQLTRAYSDIGKVGEAMKLLDLLIKTYPTSNYAAEAYFRRAEFYATRGELFEADRNYVAVLNYGPYSDFYEYSLYKRGWTNFRQGQYEDALNGFTELLDIRLLDKYNYDDLAAIGDESTINIDANIQKLQDTLRAISLSFSYLGGVNDINRYFKRIGRRRYENLIYEALANYYSEKQRYSEAAEVYTRFLKIYPYHSLAPSYYLKISEIYDLAGFTNLEIELRKDFARSFDLRSEYWTYFDLTKRQDIVEIVTKNLIDLGSYYHSIVQDNQKKRKPYEEEYKEAEEWYKRYLASFPNSSEASKTAYYLGELYFSNKEYEKASIFYEDAAYVYPRGDKSSEAAYATVVTRSLFVDTAKNEEEKNRASENFLASSLRFSYAYPNHPESKNIQLRTAKVLFETKKYFSAIKEAKFLLTNFPDLTQSDKFAAWRIIAYSLYDGNDPKTSETALIQALKYAPSKTRADRIEILNLKDNLAASIFRQAEKLRDKKKYDEALAQFKRVSEVAPKSKNTVNAEYDIASIYMLQKDWKNAVNSLLKFRKKYRRHELQKEVTKKLAVAYKEDLRFALAAKEFERIEREDKDVDFRKAALLQAASLYKSLGKISKTIATYNRYISKFPKPLENKLAIRNKVADEYKKLGKKHKRKQILQQILREAKEAKGKELTKKVIYFRASVQMELYMPIYEKYRKVKLKRPLKKYLAIKKKQFKNVLKIYGNLTKYKIANITSGATFYLGSAYLDFRKSFLESERPKKLKGLELIQYEEIIEEQAEPFEDTGIQILEKNLELLDLGLYDEWVQKTIEKLGEIFPGRFAKKERLVTIVDDIL